MHLNSSSIGDWLKTDKRENDNDAFNGKTFRWGHQNWKNKTKQKTTLEHIILLIYLFIYILSDSMRNSKQQQQQTKRGK